MCGLAGFWTLAGRHPGSIELVTAMAARLTPRGPDAGGAWIDDEGGPAFGHRRLAVVDLSPAGAQPMVSASGGSVLAYNGEIYNSDALRAGFALPSPRGHSDTETLLEALEAAGPPAAIERAIGMFAFAWYDRREKRLWLGRDRLGIKPLYWGMFDGTVLFASQPRALFIHPAWPGRLRPSVLADYLRFGVVPGGLSLFEGLQQVAPGSLVAIGADGTATLHRFWSLPAVIQAGTARRGQSLSDAEAEDQLDALILDAVRCRMVADVPLGAFLSGGIDSASVVAAMQAQADRPVRTFTIGFAEKSHDEAPAAAAIARHLGTDHMAMTVTAAEARDIVPDLPAMFDEPFGDSSAIPTALLSRLTREHVTVALSGDGGDELLAGYVRHSVVPALWQCVGGWPGGWRNGMAKALAALPVTLVDAITGLIPAARRPRQPGEKLRRLASLLSAGSEPEVWRQLVSQWPDPAGLLIEPAPGAFAADLDAPPGGLSLRDRLLWLDTAHYLPDDVLTKVDRASMAASLELRVPLLDHRLIAFAWGLPDEMKVRHGQGKWLLRRVLARRLPEALFDRPKSGFAAPVADWLRDPLRDWAEGLLAPAFLKRQGLFHAGPVQACWQAHLKGQTDASTPLWSFLMFQAWWQHWRGEAC